MATLTTNQQSILNNIEKEFNSINKTTKVDTSDLLKSIEDAIDSKIQLIKDLEALHKINLKAVQKEADRIRKILQPIADKYDFQIHISGFEDYNAKQMEHCLIRIFCPSYEHLGIPTNYNIDGYLNFKTDRVYTKDGWIEYIISPIVTYADKFRSIGTCTEEEFIQNYVDKVISVLKNRV